jgi:hypothetical protein
MSKKTMKTNEPSKASLAEMPEVNFSRLGKLSRGKYVERARRSLEVIVVDKKLVRHWADPIELPEFSTPSPKHLARRSPRSAARPRYISGETLVATALRSD